MAASIAASAAVNVVDTLWIGQLGTDSLAAMSFTFPVVAAVLALAFGMSVGLTSAVARAAGGAQEQAVRGLVTTAASMGLVLATMVGTLGIFGGPYLYEAMGAGALVPKVHQFMRVWFLGVGFIILPAWADGVLRALGHPKLPARAMVAAAVANALLDPLLIFGFGAWDGLGLDGAAWATVVSRAAAGCWVVWAMMRRLPTVRPDRNGAAWEILRVGVPASITNLTTPFATAWVVWLCAGMGESYVAGYGVAVRVVAVPLVIFSALASAMAPVVGQAFGAGDVERVRGAVTLAGRWAALWGFTAAVVMWRSAGEIAALFSPEPAVLEAAMTYLQIVPVGYPLMGPIFILGASFNAVGRAIRATLLSILRTLVLGVTFAYIGAQLDGFAGLCGGLALANLPALLLALKWSRDLSSRAPGTPRQTTDRA